MCRFFIFIGICVFLACTSDRDETSNDSPRNYLIAYNVMVDGENDDYDVWTIDPETGEKRNITKHPDVSWAYLAYDRSIFFISDRDTCARCFFLYEMDGYGRNVRRITDFMLRDSWMGVRNNGKELIVNPSQLVDSAFLIIDRDGNILHRLETGLKYSSDPVFSGHGKSIVFRGGKTASKREAGFDEALYMMQVDGNTKRQLTVYPEDDDSAPWYAYKAGPPRVHPVEDFISYQSFRQGKYSLYGVTPGGEKHWKLTENAFQEGWHDWSPDGKLLAIELFDEDQTQFHIGLMDWETKEIRILTDTTFKYQQAPVFVRK